MKPGKITHVFFDVHDVLVDRAPLSAYYAERLGVIMTERYGGTPVEWSRAYWRVVEDWFSYYADLNLSGDEGIEDMWEGLFRTTRALFRLTNTPEPSKSELTALARALPALASSGCDALYPETREVLFSLEATGRTLGVISHALSSQIHASLAPVLHHFKGTIWGADNAERFDKDVERYQTAALHARVAPENCLALDDKVDPLLNARAAGMHTIQIRRDVSTKLYANGISLPDLRGILAHCFEHI
jgi:FMN phosphatase YigB (HAD superfamily)